MDYRCRQQGGADIPVCGEALTDTATTKRGPPDENTISPCAKKGASSPKQERDHATNQ